MRAGTRLEAFVASSDLDRSRTFYVETLGLTEIETTPFALVLDGLGTILRVIRPEAVDPRPYTVLGWAVDDIEASVDALAARGVAFTRYDGFGQDERGIWTAPSGTRVVWFTDPDGNTLSLQQHPA